MSASTIYFGFLAHAGANTNITSLTGLTGQVSWSAQGLTPGFAAGVIKVTDAASGYGQLDAAAYRINTVLAIYDAGFVMGGGGGLTTIFAGSSSRIQWTTTVSGLDGTKDVGIRRQAAGVLAIEGTTTTGVRGLLGGGANVASAATLPLPTGRIFHVTGTTGFNAITSTNFESGAVITLIFDGILTVTGSASLIIVGGTMVTSANDTLTLGYDGTAWYETSRTVL